MASVTTCLTLFLIGCGLAIAERADEKRLMSGLFSDYDTRVPPAGSPSIIVGHDINLINVKDLDIEHQILSLDIWETLHWTDNRLQWDPKEFGGVYSVRVPPETIWVPGIEIYNSAGSQVGKLQQPLVLVMYNGSCYYVATKDIKSSCAVSDHIAAGDHVTCNLKMGSWTYSDDELSIQVDVPSKTDEHFLSEFSDLNRYWTVDEMHVTKTVKIYDCCPQKYGNLDYSIILKRANHL